MTETPVVNPYQRRILLALNTLGKHVYAGKETPRDRAERRLGERQAALAAMRIADRLAPVQRGQRVEHVLFLHRVEIEIVG